MEPKKQMKLKNKELPPPKLPETPPPSPAAVKSAIEAARAKITDAFKAFHALLANKKLDQNKSKPEKDEEARTTQDLFKAAQDLDNLNQGEGVMIVGSIGLRELLKLRDRLNEVEYKALLTRKELNELKEALGEKKA